MDWFAGFGDARGHDDARAFQQATGWSPRVDVQSGVRRLFEWLCDNVVPAHIPASIIKRMQTDNPLETFPRLRAN